MVFLQIYVAKHCANCDIARDLAREIAGALPDVQVELIDLEEPGAKWPDVVFATPTYLLDGRVAWLGNPRRLELFQRLSAALGQEMGLGPVPGCIR
ncbi:MAG: thioredoxin family protein [Anaerolineae bacterium]|nr:thioredoxin family protein [Anaerolineae bacterium]